MNSSTRVWIVALFVGMALVVSALPAPASYVSSDRRFPAPMYAGTNPVEYATPGGVYRAGRDSDFFDVFLEPPPLARVNLPTTPGVTQVDSFFDVFAEFDLALLPSPPVSTHAPAPMTTSATRLNGLPPGEPVWATEILEMHISGGEMPTGVRIRESPTKASLGRHSITELGGGLYRIDSFFDVFTELSIDGGQTWTPGSSANRLVGALPEPTASVLMILGSAALLGMRRRSRT
jgi:hypothetical protein